MDIVSHKINEPSNLKFNRENAKLGVSTILQKIIPEHMTLTQASKLTGTDVGNIKRGVDGKTLLNASAFSKITKTGLKLRSTYEIVNVIEQNVDVHKYLSKEIGEEYLNPDFQNEKNTVKLMKAITKRTTQQIYTLIESKKRLNCSTLFDLFGQNVALQAIQELTKNNIIIYHEQLQIVEMPISIDSSSIAYNRIQMKLLLEDITDSAIDEYKAQYSQGGFLGTKKQEDEYYKLVSHCKKLLLDKKTEIEKTPIKERNMLINYMVAYSTSIDLDLSQEEVKQ